MNGCRMMSALLTVLLALATAAAAGEPLRAGVAVVDITPPRGYRMGGYFNERLNSGTHDPLLAKVIVVQQGDARAALVECALVSMPADVASQARALGKKSPGIPARHIIVSATHSHTG